MEKTFITQKLQNITGKIAKEFQPEKIILFGSYAWGNPGPDSDVDLFIIKDTDQSRLDRGREVERIIYGSDFPIDVLVYTPAEIERRLQIQDFFIHDIITKGKVLWMKTAT